MSKYLDGKQNIKYFPYSYNKMPLRVENSSAMLLLFSTDIFSAIESINSYWYKFLRIYMLLCETGPETKFELKHEEP